MSCQLLFSTVAVVMCLFFVNGQFGDVKPARILTPEEVQAHQLNQNPDLLEFAAKFLSRVHIEITREQQTVIAQEGVNANIDCLPWIKKFNGGTTRWFFVSRDRQGNLVYPGALPVEIIDRGHGIINIGGMFNRWFNITSTIISAQATVPSQGDYTCEVCIPGGNVSQGCHNATVTLHLLGSPPQLEKAEEGRVPIPAGSQNKQFNIGTNLCITRNAIPPNSFGLLCNIRFTNLQLNISTPIPIPTRTWTSLTDGEDLYTAVDGATPTLRMEFLDVGNNALFLPGLLGPSINLIGSEGQIFFSTEVTRNLTMSPILPNLMPRDTASVHNFLFDEVLGKYRCRVENVFGGDEAETVISECVDSTEAPPPLNTTTPPSATTTPPTDNTTFAPPPLNTTTPPPATTAPPTHNVTTPLPTAPSCSEPPVQFRLRGNVIPSDSELDSGMVGVEDEALLCVTPYKNCCKARRRGEIYNIRDGVEFTLPRRGDNMPLYRNRGVGVVRLNIRTNTGPQIAGLYRCCLPDGCGEEKCIEITLV